MSQVLIDLHYFPSISYFSILNKFNTVILEDRENFQRQTYRNRCLILGANNTLKLTVPLNHKSARSIYKTEISYTDNWIANHTKSIESAYKRSPFYDYYSDDILGCLYKKHKTLWSLNHDILSTLVDILGLGNKIKLASECSEDEITRAEDFRNKIKPKKPAFVHQTQEYQQVFGTQFMPNLSVLDIIFCTGPESTTYL